MVQGEPRGRSHAGAPAATLHVRVAPRSGRSAVAGRRGDALLVRLAAPPIDGAANLALIDFLAKLLDHPRRAISLVAGARGRNKRLRFEGMDRAELDRRVAAILHRLAV